MNCGTWSVLIDSLFDHDGQQATCIRGSEPMEWLQLVMHDYDEVDRFLIEHETIGG